MSTTLTRRPPSLFDAATAAPSPEPAAAFAPAVCAPPTAAGGRPTTLEERLARTWHELNQAGEAECPMCHTAMRMQSGWGHCTSCDTRLR